MTSEHPEIIHLSLYSADVRQRENALAENCKVESRLAALDIEDEFDSLPDFFSFDLDCDSPAIHAGRRRAV